MTKDEIFNTTKEWLSEYSYSIYDHYSRINDNAESILKARYYMKDDNGNTIEDWRQLCYRVATNVSKGDTNKAMKYFNMIYNLDFLPNTPTLINAGNNTNSLSACFVYPIENDIHQICDIVKLTALTHKAGGGTGFNFSKINKLKLIDKSKIKFFYELNHNHPDYLEFMDNISSLYNDDDYTFGALSKYYNVKTLSESVKINITIEDSIEDIFNFDKLITQIEKIITDNTANIPMIFVTIDFSKIRAKDSFISTTKGKASGPVSFMSAWSALYDFITEPITPITTIKLFDRCTGCVKQGGVRRGANMGILNSDSPFIFEFLDCKKNNDSITNFNLSVGNINDKLFSDEYKDTLITLSYTYPSGNSLNESKIITYSDLLNIICDRAYDNGEPGIVFLDKINEKNTTDITIEATNPCGEQPLLPYESCNLGSINLVNMTYIDKDNNIAFDWDKYEDTIQIAVEFLDDVIDVNNYPDKRIEESTKRYRKIGLGVMGLADMFIALRIKYDSEEAIEFSEDLAKELHDVAKKRSHELYTKKKETDMNAIPNSTVTTIAPTGSISMLCNVSSGIEPVFSIVYTRKSESINEEFLVSNPFFEKDLIKLYKGDEGIINDVMNEVYKNGSVQQVMGVSNSIRDLYKTALEIPVETHIRHQSAWQKYIDNGISKTINFGNDATVEDIKNAYKLAYKYDCKGITVYRDGSRDIQVLNTGNKDSLKVKFTNKDHINNLSTMEGKSTKYEDALISDFAKKLKDLADTLYVYDALESDEDALEVSDDYEDTYISNKTTEYPVDTTLAEDVIVKALLELHPELSDMFNTEEVDTEISEDNSDSNKDSGIMPVDRPMYLNGITKKVTTGCGNLYVTVNHDDNMIYEVFTNTSKSGGCPSQSEAISRMCSLALRSGVAPKEVIRQLRGIRCPSTLKSKEAKVLSCPDAVGRVLEEVYDTVFKNNNTSTIEDKSEDNTIVVDTITNSKIGDDITKVWYDIDKSDDECINDTCTNGISGVIISPGTHQVYLSSKVIKEETEEEKQRAKLKEIKKSVSGDKIMDYYNKLLSEDLLSKVKCPDCGSLLEHDSGCVICRNCGYSKCN